MIDLTIRFSITILFSCVLLFQSGCGAIASRTRQQYGCHDLKTDPVVFRGTVYDVRTIGCGEGETPHCLPMHYLAVPFLLLDLPFSLLFDLVYIPLDVAYWRSAAEERSEMTRQCEREARQKLAGAAAP